LGNITGVHYKSVSAYQCSYRSRKAKLITRLQNDLPDDVYENTMTLFRTRL